MFITCEQKTRSTEFIHEVTRSQTVLSSSLRLGPLPSGVLCTGGGGDDGGEPPGRAPADAAVHHEQVALSGDVPRPALSPVHRRDHGTCKNTHEVFYSTRPSTFITSEHEPTRLSHRVCRFPLTLLARTGRVRLLPALAAPADD